MRSPEISGLVRDLEETRWTGRPGYPIRAMVGVTLVKSLYVTPTWTRTVALVREHAALHEAIGVEVPSVYACTASPPSSGATAPCSMPASPA